ncbi:DUF2306 domain-containing protein [Caulobacter sp.]|uniref:DUF2306 domain-containing protein n=1 Tax=Caulobacter sp. TaxID=78 RepID=UPI002B499F14|nr:DUF2306 domain-containing protein [Caulobacter sp.]HJV40569.1 DUF2306 domain-containing protein [Caulobacter sp.]
MDAKAKSIGRLVLGDDALRNAILGVVLAVLVVVVAAPKMFTGMGGFLLERGVHPHAPDWSLLAAQPLAIKLHLTAALTALLIGVALMMRVKGTGLHKTLGWTWVIAMGVTAVSSLFIRQLNPGHFSFIHLLSGWTIVGLPGAIYAIKRGKVAVHRRAMTGMFVGGLLLAGLFAFIPGRLLWTLFLG